MDLTGFLNGCIIQIILSIETMEGKSKKGGFNE